MSEKEMIERIEHVLKLAKMMPSKERADVGTLVTAIERELPPLLAALRSRPAPPDDLERKHRVPDDVMMLARAGKLIDAIKLLRHDFGLPLKEAKLLVEDAMRIEAIRATAAALAAPAPVAAPTRDPNCWVCIGDTVTADMRTCARHAPVAAPAPETPAPDAAGNLDLRALADSISDTANPSVRTPAPDAMPCPECLGMPCAACNGTGRRQEAQP